MSREPFHASVEESFGALRADLLAEGGPSISTMRNYRFAILPYPPDKEFEARRRVQALSQELEAAGWRVRAISMLQLLVDRLEAEDDRVVERYIASEKRLFQRELERGGEGTPERGLNTLKTRLGRYVEGVDGIAADVIALIEQFAEEDGGRPDKTLVWLGRVGALYPFFRSSALLKHIDGKTKGLPVVLLYPGRRDDLTALSFMGQLPADRDYRPRIY